MTTQLEASHLCDRSGNEEDAAVLHHFRVTQSSPPPSLDSLGVAGAVLGVQYVVNFVHAAKLLEVLEQFFNNYCMSTTALHVRHHQDVDGIFVPYENVLLLQVGVDGCHPASCDDQHKQH